MPLVAGRYELGQLLGSGGFASVFRAHDKVAVRDVALKVIPFSIGHSASAGVGGATARDPRVDEAADHFERFRHEALALSRLRSRHVARVFDFGRDADIGLYLVMEYIDGVPLESKAVGRALLPHEVLRVARGVLDALGDAHASGIVHRDIKPANVLLPRGRRALDEVRVLDFGIARSVRRAEVDEALGKVDTQEGVVLGTPAYMAPEQLQRGEVGPAADVYSAGLMLFELLDVGALFPGATLRDQITARLAEDPQILERVPPPLGLLLARMLARDPARRFGDGHEALAAIGDLETAPVVLDALFSPAAPSDSTRRPRDDPRKIGGAPDASEVREASEVSAGESTSAQMRAGISVRPTAAFGGRRLCRLPHDGVAALRETLHALDLAMIDALARRERGSEIGRLARALSLALRLELDAAALIVEPLESKSALARAVGAAVIAPRARKVTRARVENDRTDMWIDTVDAELAAMLASLAVAMTTREDAARNELRCRRAHERLAGAHAAVGRTAHMAQIAAGCMAGTIPTSTGLVEMLRLRDGEREPPTAFNGLVRAILLGVAGFRGDEHLARQQLERAARAAADTGNTLLEARAMVAWGGTLVEIPSRVDQGLSVLERATTLLAHGDAPSLEHIAEHNRGAALIIQGRYAEAAEHLSRARVAAKDELSPEHEMISCTNEAFAHIFLGRYEAARQALDELTDRRLATVSARTGAFAHVARSLYALLFQSLDVAFAELRRALTRAKDAEADAGDVTLLAELLGILYASARGEPVDLLPRAGELEKLAQDHGFASFYWMANLRSAAGQIRDDALRVVIEETLERLVVMLEPMSDAAER